MKSITIFVALLLATIVSFAQWTGGGEQITLSANDHYRPYLSPISAGGFYTVWVADDSLANGTIMLTAYDDDGNLMSGWTAGGNIISESGNFYGPQVITEDNGDVIVSWYGTKTGNNREYIYVQRFSPSSSPQWNGGAPLQITPSDTSNYLYPMLASDKNNGVYILYMRFDAVKSPSSVDIFIQRLDASGNVFSGWNASGAGVATLVGEREYYPRFVVNPAGDAVYVMYAKGLIGGTSMHLQKVSASNGNSLWPANGGTQISPGPYVWAAIGKDMYVFCDASGNAIAFWVEGVFSANGEIYMQKVNPSGVPLLGFGGKIIGGNTPEGAGYLDAIQDGNTFILTWNDYRVWDDVFALKFDSNGNKLWNDTLKLSTNGTTAYPKVVSDGVNGVYIFYQDISATPYKLYAMRTDTVGNLYSGWSMPGSLFGTINTQNPFFPHYDFQLSQSFTEEAFVVWTKRGGDNLHDLFACNIIGDGTVCTAASNSIADEVTSDKAWLKIFPNPVSSEAVIQYNVPMKSENAQIEIFDLTGRLVKSYELEKGKNSLKINSIDLSSGMYIYLMKMDEKIIKKEKMAVVK